MTVLVWRVRKNGRDVPSRAKFRDLFVEEAPASTLPRLFVMGLYRHPYLTRGVVHTPQGAFRINRGIVELPDELGESLPWTAVTSEDDDGPAQAAIVSMPVRRGHRTEDRSTGRLRG